MLALFSQGAGFGFAAGTSFGVMHNLLMNTTLARGWRYGLLIVAAPIVSDAPIILLMLLALEQLPAGILRLLPIVGGVFVWYLAYGAWRQFRNPPTLTATTDAAPVNLTRQTLLKGIAVNFLNPAPYIFWGTVGGTLLRTGMEQSPAHALAFLGGFYALLLGIMVGFVFLFDRLRQVDARLTRVLSLVSVVVMLLLGAQLIARGLTGG
ncbi:MAG: LysE family transporter [Armatimonadetes bacterium]|nr:LysE family transporter [Anaerolineae bacterium]